MKLHIVFLLLLTVIIYAHAEQRIGGILKRDTRLNAEDGPFTLDRDLFIPQYIRLIVSSGATIIAAPVPLQDTSITQIDKIDEITVSIKVRGTLVCQGKSDRRITFMPRQINKGGYGWYGVIFDNAENEGSDITNTDITGAYTALTVKESSVIIHRSVLDRNHIGCVFTGMGKPALSNSIIVNNLLSGIRVIEANPSIRNSIIIGNKNNGIWSDGKSKITLEYNCFHNNADGNFLDCDPEYGILNKKNSRGDSTDYASNIFLDPIFAGTPAESLAIERDLKEPTDKSKVKNPLVADIINMIRPQQENKAFHPAASGRYELSRYSPCINTGNPSDIYKDLDDSRNDMGVTGGQDLMKREASLNPESITKQKTAPKKKAAKKSKGGGSH